MLEYIDFPLRAVELNLRHYTRLIADVKTHRGYKGHGAPFIDNVPTYFIKIKQEEKWLKNYHAVMEYMESNKWNPSKYDITVRSLYTWIKYQRMVMNAGKLQGKRLDLFNELLDLAEEYRRVNQYQ